MRSEFVKQLNLSVIIVLICSVLNTLCKHWFLYLRNALVYPPGENE